MKALIKSYKRIHRDIEILEDAREGVLKKLAKQCPLQPGDKTQVSPSCRDPRFDSCHRPDCIVEDIQVREGALTLFWVVYVRIINANGKPGKRMTSWHIQIPDSNFRD